MIRSYFVKVKWSCVIVLLVLLTLNRFSCLTIWVLVSYFLFYSAQWEEYQESEAPIGSQPSMLSSRAFVELPFYSKFLLIAAYLASYNPVKSDRRFFSKHHGKVQKSKFAKKKEVIILTTSSWFCQKYFTQNIVLWKMWQRWSMFPLVMVERKNIFQYSSTCACELLSIQLGKWMHECCQICAVVHTWYCDFVVFTFLKTLLLNA